MDTNQELDLIKEDILNNLECPLKDEAQHLVFGKGNPKARIFFIGEAPGAKEDESGVPFVGSAGKRLDKLLSSIDLGIEDVYIANILKYRPPKNRDPTYEEILRHTPYLVRQIQAIQPKVIVTLGKFATAFVLSEFRPEKMKGIAPISTIHGKVHDISIQNQKYVVIPLYHPAAMLYRPKLKPVMEDDFQVIKEHL